MNENFQKILVIGCPGSGKSTFARKLKDVTGLPLYYLDMIWHKPDQSTISAQEFDQRLKEILMSEEWIIDGNYSRTLAVRLQHCDTVFFLDFPVELCLLGAASRIGKTREDLPWHVTELDPKFRQYILDFPKENLPQIYELLEKYGKEKDVFIFKTREESDAYLKDIINCQI